MATSNTSPTIRYTKNCGHQNCTCQASEHNSYCSESCATAKAEGPGTTCPCEHPECKGRRA